MSGPNLMNVRKGYADVVDHPAPGDDVCSLRQIPAGRNKGKWINVGMTPLAIRRTRTELFDLVKRLCADRELSDTDGGSR